MTEKPTCAGPVYFADQGIEVCEACGGCICCDFVHVDHSKAEYECFKDDDGVCHLKMHMDRECTDPRRQGIGSSDKTLATPTFPE